MKTNSKSRKWLVYSACFSIVIGTLVVLALPKLFYKYIITEELRIPSRVKSSYIYDLDNNGTFEVILYVSLENNIPSFLIYSNKGEVINQHTLPGNFLKTSNLIIGDPYNVDKPWIFATYERNDSIFISGFRYLDKSLFGEFFLDISTKHQNHSDIQQPYHLFADINNDNADELVLSLQAGYTLNPRKIYAIDIKNRNILTSTNFGARLYIHQSHRTFNETNRLWIPRVYNTRNYPKDHPFSDWYSWFVILNDSLTLHQYPYKLTSDFRRHQVPFVLDDEKLGKIIFSVTYTRNSPNTDSVFHVLDFNGTRIKTSSFDLDDVVSIKTILRLSASKILILLTNGDVYAIGSTLKTKKIGHLTNPNYMEAIDLNLDGKTEYIVFTTNPKKIDIYDSNFQNPISYISDWVISGVQCATTAGLQPRTSLLVKDEYRTVLLNYEENPNYYLKFPSLLVLFTTLFGLIFGFFRIRYSFRIENEKQLLDMQLNSFRERFNSHFTFNILNSIGSVIHTGNRELAYSTFTKFSGLIRAGLEYSEEMSIPLKNEVEYCHRYLDLQKFRYEESLVFTLNICEQVDMDQQVPKLLIQTYVENIFKHAVEPDKLCQIRIDITQKNNLTEINIEDNGKNNSTNSNSGRGTQLMNNYFKLFAKFSKTKINHERISITDTQNEKIGTRVIITISR